MPRSPDHEPSIRKGRAAEIHSQFTPSRELAWMLGVLSGSGEVNQSRGTIRIRESNIPLLAEFKKQGEKLFHKNAHERDEQKDSKGRVIKEVIFYNSTLSRELGDFSSGNWSDTVRDKYKWVLRQPDYTRAFIEGFFDTKGNIGTDVSRQITFQVPNRNVANYVNTLFARLGIKHPHTFPDKRSPESRIIQIYRLKDLKHFALNIRSHNSDKEEKLDTFRRLSLQKSERIELSKKVTNLEALEVYFRIRKKLGRPPGVRDYHRLNEQKDTLLTFDFYRNKFGKGSYPKARKYLERKYRKWEKSKREKKAHGSVRLGQSRSGEVYTG